jgi:hypothetical protein
MVGAGSALLALCFGGCLRVHRLHKRAGGDCEGRPLRGVQGQANGAGGNAVKVHLSVVTVFMMASFASAQNPPCTYRHSGPALLPDPKCTPGAIRTTDFAEVCDPNFRTAKYRHTTFATKKKVCEEYGVKGCPHYGKLEIDHLVPLEAGGLDDIRDLWPQLAEPRPGYHEKDLVENYLRHAVCIDRTMSLKGAQECLESDWFRCGVEHGILDEKGNYVGGKK